MTGDPPAPQGWDRADHRCGRCGHTFTSTTPADFVARYSTHDLAHAIVDALSADRFSADLGKQVARLLSTP